MSQNRCSGLLQHQEFSSNGKKTCQVKIFLSTDVLFMPFEQNVQASDGPHLEFKFTKNYILHGLFKLDLLVVFEDNTPAKKESKLKLKECFIIFSLLAHLPVVIAATTMTTCTVTLFLVNYQPKVYFSLVFSHQGELQIYARNECHILAGRNQLDTTGYAFIK